MELAAVFLVTVLVVGTAIAGPSSVRPTETCSTECTKIPNSKFKYEKGVTYIYDYETKTKTSVIGTSEDETKTKLSSKVAIEVVNDCDFKLKIRNVKVEIPGMDSRKIQGYQSTLASRELVFSFNDGKIEHICPSSEDPVWSVNIKRGILSAIQNNMRDLKTDDSIREIDVSGNCKTDYKHETSIWGANKIVKTKNIDSCTNRHGNMSYIQSDHYFIPYAGIQNLPVMISSSVCTQSMQKSSIIDTVECEETHRFRPFANKEKGATTKVMSKLTYETEKKSASSLGKLYPRQSLLFEHIDENKEVSTRHDLEKIIYEICSNSKIEIKSDLPELFNQVVAIMQTLSEKDITDVHEKLKGDKACKSSMAMSVFMDALPVAGNAGSLSLLVKMISTNHMSSLKVKAMLTGLAFHPRPTEESIKAMLPLIDTSVSGVQADSLLTVSSMIHTYCRQNTKCQDSSVLDDVYNHLRKLLGYKCRTNKPEESRAAILALKSLGNIGRLGRLSSMIQTCYEHPSVPHKVRLAAIESYRRVPCSEEEAKNKFSFLKKTSEDAELRIAAYLSTMRCVAELRSYTLLHQVVNFWKLEQVNQVGSFIWSHLTNLQETSSPVKQQLKQMLLRYSWKERTPNDIRQFSRNFEWSTMNDKYNVGGDLESNVIFTPKSYLPRSFMANVSANLFGYSVNMLEIGGRMEGLDHYVEKYLATHNAGPALKSILTKLPTEIYDKVKEIENRVNRQKRSTYSDDHMQDIDRQVNEISQADVDGSIYVKIFGNEIKFVTLDDFKNMKAASIPSISEIFKKMADNNDISIARSMIFANNKFSVPTISGLPVRIAVNGTSSLGLKIKGKFDVRKGIFQPRALDIDGSIEPSGAIMISSAMYVDTGISRHGLKMKINYHSSSTVSGKLFYKDGEVEVKIDTPRKNIDLLTMKSEMMMINPGREVPLKLINLKNYKFDVCFQRLSKLLGMDVCVDFSAPKYNSYMSYSLYNPKSAQISLKKVDHAMTGYKFSAKYQMPRRFFDDMLLKLEFDTPGSKTNRHILFDMSMKNKDQRLNVLFKSPIASLDVIGSLNFKEYLRRAELDFTYEGTKRYLVNADMNIKKTTRDSFVYDPKIRIEFPDKTPITLKGKFKVYYKNQSLHMVDVDLKSVQYNTEPSAVKILVKKEGELNKKFSASTNMSFEFPSFKFYGEKFFSKNSEVFSSDAVFQHEPKGEERNTITWNAKVKNLSTETFRKYNTIFGWTNALNSDWNWHTVWDMQMAKGHMENGLTIGYGKNVNWDKHNIKYLKIIEYRFNEKKELTFFDVQAKLRQATRRMDYGLHTIFNLEKNDKKPHVTLNSTIKYATDKKITSSMDFHVKSFDPISMNTEVLVTTPDRNIIYREEISQKPEKDGFNGNVFIQWDPKKSFKHTYHLNIRDKNDPPKQVEFTGTINGKGFESIYPITYEFKRDTISLLSQYDALVKVKNIPEYNISIQHDKGIKLINGVWEFPITTGSFNYEEKSRFNFDLLIKKPEVSVKTNIFKKENKFDAEVFWNVKSDPKKQFSFDVHWKKAPSNKHVINGKVMFQNKKLFDVRAKGNEDVLYGPHSIDTEIRLPKKVPIRIFSKYELNPTKLETVFDYYHKQQRKVHSSLLSNFRFGEDQMLSGDVKFIIKSQYEAIRDFELNYEFRNEMGLKNKEFDHFETFFLKVRPGKEIRIVETLKLFFHERNGKKSASFRGNTVLTTPYKGFERLETEISGRVTEDWELTLNSKGKGFNVSFVDQSVIVSILTNKIDIAYSMKSGELGSIDFGVLATKSPDYKSWTYDGFLMRNDREYTLNMSKISFSRIETTNMILKTPYESLKHLEVVRNNDLYDPYGVDISAKWNSDQNASVIFKTSHERDIIRIESGLSSPWFAKIAMDAKIKNTENYKVYQLSITRKNKQFFHIKTTRSLFAQKAVNTLLFKFNRHKLLDLNVVNLWRPRHVEMNIVASGAFNKIEMATTMSTSENGYEPKIQICTSSDKCIKMNIKMAYSVLEDLGQSAAQFEITMETNPKHVMNLKFHADKKPAVTTSQLLVTFNQESNRYLGYNFRYEPKKHMKLEIVSPDRKGHLIYDNSESGRGITHEIAITGNADDHALQMKFFLSTLRDSFRLDVTHPSLKKPIVVKFQTRSLPNRYTTQTDIEYSMDKSRHLKIATSAAKNNGNFTAYLRMYTPHSKRVNIHMKAHIGLMKNEFSVGTSASWQPRHFNAKPKEIFIYYILKKPSTTFDFYYRHPSRVIDVHGNYRKKLLSRNNRGYGMSAVAENNGVKQNLEGELSFNDLWINLLVTEDANPSERYRVNFASLPDDKTIRIIAERHTNGQILREVTTKLHLNSSHVVHTSVQWNPVVIKKLIADTREDLKRMWDNVNTTRDALDEIGLEIRDKFMVVSDAVSQEIFIPMVDHVKEDLEESAKELSDEYQKFEKMVNIHLEELKKFISKEAELVKAKVNLALKPLKKGLKELKDSIKTTVESFLQEFEKKFPGMYETFENIKNITISISSGVGDEYDKLKDIYEDLGFKGILSELRNVTSMDRLFESYNVTAAVYRWTEYLSNEMRRLNGAITEAYDRFVSKISSSTWYQTLVKYKEYVSDKIGEYKYRWNESIRKFEEDLDKYPALKKFRDRFKSSFLKIIKTYGYQSPSQYWRYVDLNMLRMIVPYEPVANIKNGFMSIDLALPYTLSAAKEWSSSQTSQETGYSYWDAYYQMKPHSNPRKWIPPFDTFASLIDSQHYLTFDKKHYDFVGECSYVLAKDFKDGNLTVIGHYGRNNKISLTIIVGENKIHISNDFKVLLNGKETELPINLDRISVSRKSNTIIVSSNRNRIECDWIHDVCTVYLNGWYFGKTAGMFGRYDNEPTTDIRKPSGETVKEISELADSWSVSSRCSTLKNGPESGIKLSEDSKAYKRCVGHFNFNFRKSPFRPCFSIIPPIEYMNMCLKSSSDKKFCSITSAYVSACRNKEAYIHMPAECVTCNIRSSYQSKLLQRGESVKIKTDMRRKKTDVVYIIENKECNTPMIKKLLTQPPRILSRELKTQQIYSRVSVISYGGKNQPEIHTARGKFFYSFRDMVLAMRTLYKMPRASSDEPSDAFEAIRIASEMPFQVSSAKIFILVKCTSCKDASTISYSDTQSLLLQQGIILHVMTPDPIVIKSGNVGKSKKMFGISAKSVFSQKDITQKILLGTPSLRTLVAVPKDLCIALAQEVGGTFFTTLPMKYRSLEKKFDLVMSRQITSTAVPAECQNCVCVSTFDGVGKTICTPCEVSSPLQPSNIYQTEEDLNLIYRRMKSRKRSKKQ